MNIAYFTHSLVSCWNHGNAHFVRGVLRALIEQGHSVRSFEPIDGWSRTNLVADQGEQSLAAFATAYPDLAPHAHFVQPDLDEMLDGVELVLVHEWTEPSLIAAIGARRRRGARFTLLFHDTHHRAVSDPEAIRRLDLDGYDGVLAFGSALAALYRDAGWGKRAFVWHEAADDRRFRPPTAEDDRAGVVWIGNWGDEERSEELHRYLLRPAASLGLALDVYGVRYPQGGIDAIAAAGGRYHGWIANADVPAAFARHRMTVHVPRCFYADRLPGIPTIRVFEALACGIPLVCSPWDDCEGLFRPGDFLLAADPAQMAAHLRALDADAALRASLATHGRETILARHTCAHRARELLGVAAQIGQSARLEIA
jgi:spore maturation protein CgeB